MKGYIISDMLTMLGRSMKHILRSLDTVITVCLTPIAMMLLFVYVFGGSMGNGMTSGEYVTYMLPGILVMAIASGIAYTAIRLFNDVKNGFFERFRTMPISASSALWSHVLTSIVSNGLSILVIIIIAYFMGFRPEASLMNWLIILGILFLFTLALTWLAVIAGLSAHSAEGASAFSYPLAYLPFLSSAFVPTETMPIALRIFAENQPVTSIVDTIRALLLSQPIGSEIWIACGWCILLLVISYFIAMKIYKEKN